MPGAGEVATVKGAVLEAAGARGGSSLFSRGLCSWGGSGDGLGESGGCHGPPTSQDERRYFTSKLSGMFR